MSVTFIDILFILLPAILVAAVIYFLFRQFLMNQLKMQALRNTSANKSTLLPLKLQAYERLVLLCERISPAQLILRLKTPAMASRDLQSALILAIQQEYEHNISQQLYVSDKLWKIIGLAKNQYIEIISQVASTVDPESSSDELASRIIKLINESKKDPIETAKRAVKREAGLLF